jgi:cell division GTPase FtsZ
MTGSNDTSQVFTDYESRVGIVGLGGCGCRLLLKYMRNRKPKDNPHTYLLAANTDVKILQEYFGSVDPDVKAWVEAGAFTPLQIGVEETKGKGAGADPEVGERAVRSEKSAEVIKAFLADKDMPILIAGEGGGTGGGAIPVVAEFAKENKAKISIVMMPGLNEGSRRRKRAETGVKKLLKLSPVIILRNEFLKEFIPKRFGVDKANITREQAWDAMNDETVDLVVSTIQRIFQKTGTTVNIDAADWTRGMVEGRLPFTGVYLEEPEKAKGDSVEKIVNHLLEGKFQDTSLVKRGKVMFVWIEGPWGTLKSDEIVDALKNRVCEGDPSKAEDFEVFIGDSTATSNGKMSISVVIVSDSPETAASESESEAEPAETVVRIAVPIAAAPAKAAEKAIEPIAAQTHVEPAPEKPAAARLTPLTFKADKTGRMVTRMVEPEVAQRFGMAHNHSANREEVEAAINEVEEKTGIRPAQPDRFAEKPPASSRVGKLFSFFGMERKLNTEENGGIS